MRHQIRGKGRDEGEGGGRTWQRTYNTAINTWWCHSMKLVGNSLGCILYTVLNKSYQHLEHHRCGMTQSASNAKCTCNLCTSGFISIWMLIIYIVFFIYKQNSRCFCDNLILWFQIICTTNHSYTILVDITSIIRYFMSVWL